MRVYQNHSGYIRTTQDGRFFMAFKPEQVEMDIFDTLEEAKSYLGEGAKSTPLPGSWVLIPSGCDIEVMADREEELQALFAELAEEEAEEWKVAA